MRALPLFVAFVAVSALGCGKLQAARQTQARNEACTIQSAALLANVTDATCPTPAALVAHHQLSGSTSDPWGNAYIVSCDSDDIMVRSAGPDGKASTADDVAMDGPSCKALH